MSSNRSTKRNRSFLTVIAFFASFLMAVLLLRKGIVLTPDGWAYWQGAVSLLHGNGYCYFGGSPILIFPPLFSFYLAGVQKIFGVSGYALLIGLATLAGLTSSTWVYFFTSLSKKETTLSFQEVLITIYVSMFIPFHSRCVLSETLLLLILGVLFIYFSSLQFRENKSSLLKQLSIVSIFLSLLLITKNSAVVFIPGFVIGLFLLMDEFPFIKKSFLAIFTGITSLSIWYFVRYLLGQVESHSVDLGGRYTAFEYFEQICAGLAGSFMPVKYLNIFVFVLLLLLIIDFYYTIFFQVDKKQYPELKKISFTLSIVLLSGLGLYIIFNLTYITDLLSWRFLWPITLTLFGSLTVYSSWCSNTKKNIVLLIVLSVLTITQSARSIEIALLPAEDYGDMYVKLNTIIHPDYLSKESIQKDGFILIAPPNFE